MKINKIVSLFAVLGLLVSFGGFTGAALADNDDHEKEAKLVGSTLEVHMTDKGKVLVRGAKVTSVGTNSITAVTVWGSYSMTWNVVPDANANWLRRHGGQSSISEVQVGNFISFQGMIDPAVASPATVKAAIIKNWSMQKVSSTLSGMVKSVDAANTRFVLTTASRGDITVQANSSTQIKLGDATSAFSGIQVGMRVTEVKGLYDNTTKILVAEKIRIASSNALLQKRTFEGTLKSIAGTAAPTTMVVTINGVDYTVNIAADTSILNNNWLRAALSGFAAGNKVRIYGAVQAQNQTTIDATVVRNTSI